MARKPRVRKVPIVNKEFVWEIEVDDEIHEYKVFLTEDECITYEDGVECDRLPIQDKMQMEGLLQIDTKTKVFDEVLPFQLEAGIPYIKLEGYWKASDTTDEDRIQERVHMYKKQSYILVGVGLLMLLLTLVQFLVEGSIGEWPMMPIMGCFMIACAAMTLVRVKNELEAMGKTFSWKL